jgi:hypothetical protein
MSGWSQHKNSVASLASSRHPMVNSAGRRASNLSYLSDKWQATWRKARPAVIRYACGPLHCRPAFLSPPPAPPLRQVHAHAWRRGSRSGQGDRILPDVSGGAAPPKAEGCCGASMVARCGAGGRARTGTGLAALRIFLPTTAFAALAPRRLSANAQVRGLDYPFTLAFARERSRVRCCPSSLYTFPRRLRAKGLARDCHVTGFPEFGQFCIAGFPTRTQACSSPLRLPVSPRPQSIRYSGTRRWGQ